MGATCGTVSGQILNFLKFRSIQRFVLEQERRFTVPLLLAVATRKSHLKEAQNKY